MFINTLALTWLLLYPFDATEACNIHDHTIYNYCWQLYSTEAPLSQYWASMCTR